MKNIHLFPTDKPSRFVTSKGKKNCYLYSIEEFKDIEKFIEYDSKSWDSQNICITNDEEIKEGDWVIYTKGIKIHCKKLDNKEDVELANIENSGVLKIILTTDQDLILDGVQPIPDEFLEWFVKNPSCEFIRVGLEIWNDGNHNPIIIIPKEEPKQETLEEIANKLSIKEAKDLDLFLKGIEWQKEKDKKMYSLDDLKEAFAMGRTNATIKDFNTKFEKE